jgi:hypothetical protein
MAYEVFDGTGMIGQSLIGSRALAAYGDVDGPSRIVKIFEFAFPLEVTPLPSPML